MSCTQEVYPIGTQEVTIAGSSNADNYQVTITTAAPQVLIAPSVTKRDGVVIRNNEDIASGNDISIGFSALKAAIGTGFRVVPQGGITLTIGPGVTVYAQAYQNTADMRIIETGS